MRMFAIGLGAVPERVTNAHEGMEGKEGRVQREDEKR
jgi:hypothetical protein